MPLDFDAMRWRVTNDVVMGGLSQSRFETRESGIVFEGQLSRENNGGFASVLGELAQPFRGFAAIRLTVSGDGRRYQLRLRETGDSRAPAWRAHFETGEESVRVTLTPEQFHPVIRGEPVIGAPPLANTVIRHLGLMLAGGEEGPFRLRVHDLEIVPKRSLGDNRLVIGASRGIGLKLTEALLADERCKILIATHRPGSDTEQLEALRGRSRERLELLPLDVTRRDSLDRLADRAASLEDGLDLVIHAAGILHDGILQPEKMLARCEPEHLLRLFEVNSIGPLMTAKALIPSQKRKKRFVFAALSAMVGSIGDNRLGGWYGYRASKSALNQFVRTLSNECRVSHPAGIVVALHPGTTDTELSRPFQRNVPSRRLYTPDRTASRLLQVIGQLDPADSGCFFNWDGSEIPW